ncbi:MAG: DNA polymerase III subunit beta [Lachnospiraceae bacterium]
MKIICKKTDLLKSINISLRAISNKTTMKILECILIEAKNNVIKFISNDMDLGIETKVEGTIESEGTIAIDAKIFSEIVRKLPDNFVTIETDDALSITILCEKSNFNIPGKSGEDFTFLPNVPKEQRISLSSYTLKEMINQTIFSIAINENNKIMTGELFEINNNNLKIVSLDGHRIAIRNQQLANTYEDKKVIVPGKTLMDLSKILSGEIDNVVDIFISSNHIVFQFDDTLVVSRLIEGEYFKIDQMLAIEYETKLTINKKDFLSSIDRSTLLVREGEKKPIVINITDELMELKIDSSIGSMDEQIEISKSGKDIIIGFNPRFLIDALRVIEDETITIYMVNSKSPCVIKNDEESYVYLILPVNFNQIY